MTVLGDLTSALDDVGCTLLRAVPRSSSHLLLQVRDADGAESAGQWFADPGQAAAVAAATAVAATPGVGGVQALGNVVIQPGGADRRLPALAELAGEPGARLVAHRPERRGVVAHRVDGERRFTKVVRPSRVVALADGLRRAAEVLDVPVPEVVGVDPAQGRVTTAALPGETLHDRLAGGVDDAEAQGVGRVLADLHRGPPPPGTSSHAAADEVAVTRRWLDHAEAFGATPLPARALTRGTARMEALLAAAPGGRALLHRDLHDKQLLLSPDGTGVLDLDLLAVGDPALDLANLLVHLELRARQGLVGEDTVRRVGERLVAAYDPSTAVRDTVPGYLLATRLRLVAVYAFRPASTAAAVRVLNDPMFDQLPG